MKPARIIEIDQARELPNNFKAYTATSGEEAAQLHYAMEKAHPEVIYVIRESPFKNKEWRYYAIPIQQEDTHE